MASWRLGWFGLVLLLVCAGASGTDGVAHPAMQTAAREFVAALTDAQRQQSAMPFEGEERLNWGFVPRDRHGLPLGQLRPEQHQLAQSLLLSGLSAVGHRKATEIIEVEGVLFERSGGDPIRDPGNYFVSVFGLPESDGAWGWRFEGHHISLNFTLIDDRVISTTPAFLGASPAHVRSGAKAGLHPLKQEEELARRLLLSLDPRHQGRAIIEEVAPADILTAQTVHAEVLPQEGLLFDEMNAEQAAVLLELLSLYAERLHADLAADEMAVVRASGLEKLRFAWAGGKQPGEPHYYRIQGPTFVVEYDNTQNDANHSHSVWRNYGRDFGIDPLRQHLALAHGMATAARLSGHDR